MAASSPQESAEKSGAASDAAGGAIAAFLEGVARLRGGKAVHPHGTTYSARFVMDGGASAPAGSELLDNAGDRQALVRFSRSLGLPRPLPDLLGMSIRVLDAYGPERHQDFLMVTSVDMPVLRHLFVPAGDVQQRLYSSSLPYRTADETFLVGTRAAADSPRPGGDDEFDRLAKAAATGALRFDFLIAHPFGRFKRIGEVRVEPHPVEQLDALRFNPFNTGDDLQLVGPINDWRRKAYPRSQAAWRATDDNAAEQDRADDAVRALASRR